MDIHILCQLQRKMFRDPQVASLQIHIKDLYIFLSSVLFSCALLGQTHTFLPLDDYWSELQSGGEDTGAAQVWDVFLFALLRWGVSPHQFTASFLKMGKKMTFIFTCCHVSATWRRAGCYLFFAFFFSVSNSTLAVNGLCLISKSASVVTPSSGGMVSSQHVQDLLSPWQQFLFFFFFLKLHSFAALFYSQKLCRASVLARTLSTSPSPRGEYTSCEWQEVQIKDGTEYFLERWAAMGGNELTQEI